jgi:hypothetical protein
MTPFQLDASAKAPCTSTIVGLTSACRDCWSVAFTGNLLQCGNAAHVVPAGDDAGTHGMTASHVAPRARPALTHARLRDQDLAVPDSGKPHHLRHPRSHPEPPHHTRQHPGRYPGPSRPPGRPANPRVRSRPRRARHAPPPGSHPPTASISRPVHRISAAAQQYPDPRYGQRELSTPDRFGAVKAVGVGDLDLSPQGWKTRDAHLGRADESAPAS